jgi:xylulokinase
MYLIGMDLGTTKIKGLIFTATGEIVASASRPTPTHFRGPEIADFYPEEFWAEVQAILQQLTAACPHPEAIRGIAFSSFGEAGVALDAQGAPLAPAIAWFDQRTIEVVDEWRSRVDEQEIFRTTGVRITHVPSLAKILWEKRHLPEVSRKTRTWLFVPSYIVFRLTGEYRADFSLASRSLLFDVRRRAWSARMCDLAGIPMDILPPLAPSGSAVGTIRPEVAADLGLAPGVTVSLGGHDHLCGALSAGIRQRGQLLNSSGTADALFALIDPIQIDDRFFHAGVSCGCHVVGGETYLLGGAHAAGRMIDWVLDNFYAEQSTPRDRLYATMVERASTAPIGSNGVIVVPHLRGCLTPYNDPLAKGAILGLRSTHTLNDITRALFEGLSLDVRVIVDTYSELTGDPYPELKYIGGGSRNAFWIQMKADVLERRIRVSTIGENASLGAALLAGMGCGLYRDADEACAAVSAEEIEFLPDPASSARYREIYERVYRGLHRQMVGVNRDLESLQKHLSRE